MPHLINLPEDQMPTHWYNIQADLPSPAPPVMHPGTKQPIGPADLAPLFPDALIMQEVSQERYIEIPAPVQDVFRKWRPSPLYRAEALEKALDTPAKIYYKYEGVSPAGSHKPNTAVPQVYYNKEAGVKRITTETGAGQWGSALSFAGAHFGVDIEVYQVRVSYDAKPYRRAFMETFGAKCYPSPSDRTNAGRAVLEKDPNSPGSLGIAISEAVECAATDENTKYALGSVLNHVLMHQTIIGQEAIKQMEIAGDYPDVLVGCTGGGSNFAGLCFPFIGQKFRGENKKPFRVVAVEPAACPSLTKGKYAYDFGDTAGMTPLIKSHTLGHTFMPPPLHAGGLRYHGMAPLISHLKELGELDAVAYQQKECFEAGKLFAQAEGILPAPEANHAIKGAVDEALKCKESGEAKVILFNMCGHGHFDMAAWSKFNSGELVDHEFAADEVAMALSGIPQV
jgi:tryptophan synthase beta chain